VALHVRPGLGLTSPELGSEYVSLTGELLAFALVGERWNVAVRARAATISRVPPHLELYAGGLDLVRGFPDNYVRTRTMTFANLEVRCVAFDSTWIALIPAAFVDGLAARAPQGVPGVALSAGAGLRIVIPKFVASGLRADLALPLASTIRAVGPEDGQFGPSTPVARLGRPEPSFGVFQFF
jgi:hypothetical protein